MRWLLLMVVVLVLSGLACSDDDEKLALGERCGAHEECASGLCSVPVPDGGLTDGGITPAKRCMEPSL